MGLNLQLQSLVLPSGTEFPGTMQALLDLIVQYESIVGDENFSGINYGPTTPDASNRDKPWFKTDGSFHSIGWYAWNGTIWDRIQVLPQTGNFADAPTAIGTGQLYYASDIKVMCVWNGSAWVTLDGAPGEIRFVRGTNITTILASYPGWTQVTDIAAQAIAVAGDGTGSGFSDRSPETTTGAETIIQTTAQLAPHTHTVTASNSSGAAGAQAGSNSAIKQETSLTTSTTGSGDPMSVMQPTRFLYCIQKT